MLPHWHCILALSVTRRDEKRVTRGVLLGIREFFPALCLHFNLKSRPTNSTRPVTQHPLLYQSAKHFLFFQICVIVFQEKHIISTVFWICVKTARNRFIVILTCVLLLSDNKRSDYVMFFIWCGSTISLLNKITIKKRLLKL